MKGEQNIIELLWSLQNELRLALNVNPRMDMRTDVRNDVLLKDELTRSRRSCLPFHLAINYCLPRKFTIAVGRTDALYIASISKVDVLFYGATLQPFASLFEFRFYKRRSGCSLKTLKLCELMLHFPILSSAIESCALFLKVFAYCSILFISF